MFSYPETKCTEGNSVKYLFLAFLEEERKKKKSKELKVLRNLIEKKWK